VRGWCGASGGNGRFFAVPVTIPHSRLEVTRELLLDLSRPGTCIVLGAGASHGVVPIAPKEITAAASKMLQAQGSFRALSSDERKLLSCHPEIKYLTDLLQRIPTGSWDRFVLDHLDPGNGLNRMLITLGRVPLFYFILQMVVAHGFGVLLGYLAGKSIAYLFLNFPASPSNAPPNAGFGLGVVYAAWVGGLLILYPLSLWYSKIKQCHGGFPFSTTTIAETPVGLQRGLRSQKPSPREGGTSSVTMSMLTGSGPLWPWIRE
jgi:hypothetical protein